MKIAAFSSFVVVAFQSVAAKILHMILISIHQFYCLHINSTLSSLTSEFKPVFDHVFETDIKRGSFSLWNDCVLLIKMADLQDGLLLGKGKKQSKQYRRRFDQCQLKVKTLRNKNNQLQKQCENEMDSDIRQAIKFQAAYLEKEITDIKNLISGLTRDFTDPSSKTKIKELWNMAGKEIERNKRIMAEFVNRASSYPSFLKRSSQYRSKDYTRNENPQRAKNITVNQAHHKQWSSLVEGDEIEDGEVMIQERIMAEKKALLKEIQEKNMKINKLYNQMGSMLAGEQRDMLNQIEANNLQTKQNLVHANEELKEAIVEQKKSKKKYICLVTTIIILILIGAGIIYLFVK